MGRRRAEDKEGDQKAISASTQPARASAEGNEAAKGEDGEKERALADQSGHAEVLGESTGAFPRKLRQALWQ
jgi:hypothetical protein